MDKNATQGETKEETSSAEALHQIQLDFEFDFYEEKQAQRMIVLNVDAVLTDVPELVLEALEEIPK